MIQNILLINNIKLSKNEQDFFNFIKDNNIDISKYTTNELAKLSYVSKSTITRFAKKLGFSGLAELKYKLNEYSQNKDKNSKYINENNSQVFARYYNTISNTKLISDEVLILIDKFKEFKSIFIIGVGTSNLIAKEFSYMLTDYGLTNVENVSDSYNQALKSKIATSNDLLIVFSLNGKNHDILTATNNFKKNQATILAISANEHSALKSLSDYFILAPIYNKNTSKLLPLLIVVDMIINYLNYKSL